MIHQLVQLRQFRVPALAPPARENHHRSDCLNPLRGTIPCTSEIACITYCKTDHRLLQLRRPCRISLPVTFPRHSLLSTLLLVPQLLSLVMDPYRVPLPRVLPRYQPPRNRCMVNRSPGLAMPPMPSKGLSSWREAGLLVLVPVLDGRNKRTTRLLLPPTKTYVLPRRRRPLHPVDLKLPRLLEATAYGVKRARVVRAPPLPYRIHSPSQTSIPLLPLHGLLSTDTPL
ncbi:hypothetical protein F5146DRAFT_130386 [Armillaria mellea]|nr:hypothetical protein F5146DRAFT_130386 [Armillaria mellea]